ncbi:MAG: multiple sugar transport system ATP-binding protein [Candidatus Tokpelaia sp. JSC161]|jgi:multiple sugar transport system ATP-binding protein|nr:MAG: multiple sugar transport system ATP-binding protein [Candidatus Tokpelaia sp. JSC161]
MAKIQLKNLKKSYGAIEVIKNINLEVHQGEFIVFIGPSGSGKSTLLRLISGLGEMTSGELLFDGELVNNLPPAERGIAMVFQSYALYPHMNVYANMAFGMKLAKANKEKIKKRVLDTAYLLQIEHLLDRLPKHLSGGERQRVAIGRAIVRNPRVFLFDEPLSNLDAALRGTMRLEIAKLHRSMQNVTMIYVTHDQIEAMTLADRIVVLRDGQIEQVGTPQEIYEKPQSQFVAKFIGNPEMNFLTGSFSTHLGCSTLGIRPEHIDIVPHGSGVWSGKLVHSENLGADTYLFVEIGADKPLIVRQNNTRPIPLQSKITLNPREEKHLYRFDSDGKPVLAR